jgi:hypothetical protein
VTDEISKSSGVQVSVENAKRKQLKSTGSASSTSTLGDVINRSRKAAPGRVPNGVPSGASSYSSPDAAVSPTAANASADSSAERSSLSIGVLAAGSFVACSSQSVKVRWHLLLLVASAGMRS